jgi:DNA-directed RNA polymerase subunit RPC12/RpoP
MRNLFNNNVKIDNMDFTHMESNDKPSNLATFAHCSECNESWELYGKGGPNRCPKCASDWWVKNKGRVISYYHKERSA